MMVIDNIYFLLKGKLQYYRLHNRIKRLIRDGLHLGENVTIMPSVRIDDEYPFLIEIGDNCSLSHGVTILAHDATTFKFTQGYTKLEKVVIHDNVYFGENVIVLPGSVIGPNSLVASGSVVNKRIPPNSCNAGIPARRYHDFGEFIDNHKKLISQNAIFEYKELHGPNYREARQKVKQIIDNEDIIYVRGTISGVPFTFNGRDFR
ncbi:MAG: acyltransferase [Tissierellales bacterium]|nr:acyltransferase [Tissierellales bacterium]